jgi:hypothetical protein
MSRSYTSSPPLRLHASMACNGTPLPYGIEPYPYTMAERVFIPNPFFTCYINFEIKYL